MPESKAQKVDLGMDRGTKKQFEHEIIDNETNAPLDLSGYTVTFVLEAMLGDAVKLIERACVNQSPTTDGKCRDQMTVANSQLGLATADTIYPYSLHITNGTVVKKVQYGDFTFYARPDLA